MDSAVDAGDTSQANSEAARSPGSATNGRAQVWTPLFGVCWYTVNALLVLSILAAIYCGVWEYSTRRYLKGFSDAIIPENSAPQEKVQAILDWMAHGPQRQERLPTTSLPDRDPTDTLNYAALLKVCGSATNAFINLAESGGLSARRLLLLDSRQMTKHVAAEVLIEGRWIVVDPAFREILRDANGVLVTRQQLADPVVFRAVTAQIPDYDSTYTYDRTAHVRFERFPIVGMFVKTVLEHVLRGAESSAELSLILERKSFAAAIMAFICVAAFSIIRIGLRWYGEDCLGIRLIRVRQQARRALHAFFAIGG